MLDEIFEKEKAMKHAKNENDHYADIYENWFKTKVWDVRNFLEIGVHKGGALRAWAQYFPIATIYGIDIKNKFDWEKTFDKKRIKFTVGDITDINVVNKIYSGVEFDVIIDDASHMVEDQIITFLRMFQRVVFGGVYIVEDIHTSYWPKFGGGYKRKNTFIEFVKDIIDMPNYWAYKITDRAEEYKIEEKILWLEENIKSISIYKGLCFIERQDKT